MRNGISRQRLLLLLGLRYRLLWATARTRSGKVALFVVGYFCAVLVMLFLALGGFAAAAGGIRAGKSELVARAVMGGLYAAALLSSVILGIGINPAFSHEALRRYPLSELDRLVARHGIALFDPLWLFLLSLNLGLAAGFAMLGGASPLLSAAAALLVVATNYLLARVLGSLVERLVATPRGQLVLLSIVLAATAGPALLGPALRSNLQLAAPADAALALTPPLAGASILAGNSPAVPFLALVVWFAGLATGVWALDRLPKRPRTTVGAAVTWDDWYDRTAAHFGPVMGPLVAKTLRYYVRSPQLRFNYPFVLPICFLLLAALHNDPRELFPRALGLFAVMGFMSTGAMSLNVFGFDCGGFRRYHIFPVPPGLIVRAASVVPLLLGGAQVIAGLLLWLALFPGSTSIRMFVMLLASGVGGLCLLHGLGMWTSLLSPRPIPFDAMFGNRLSLAANVVMIVGVLAFVLLPQLLKMAGMEAVLRHWWLAPICAGAGIAFYWLTMMAASQVFGKRRERMILQMDGREQG